MTTTIHARALVATLLVAGALLTGCSAGAGSESDGDIASLSSPGPTAASDTDALFAEYGEPVRLRLDMTDEENAAAYAIYDACLEDHGGSQKLKEQSDAVTASGEDLEVDGAVCAPLIPLPPWELDRANPDALAFGQGVVDCLKGKGVSQVEIAPDDGYGEVNISLGGPENDSRSISLGLEFMLECQRNVSAATQ